MKSFRISPNEFLRRDTLAYYHSNYEGGGRWKIQGTVENMICTFKNDRTPYPDSVLQRASNQLQQILAVDLPQILQQTVVKKKDGTTSKLGNVTVCIVPRAKAEKTYRSNQLLLKTTIRNTVLALDGFSDGSNYIVRHTDTLTTHSAKSGNGGGGRAPYPNITKDTCHISDEVIGKDILLIDDLYTKTVNIDEDAIQALLDKGANRVMFYSIGKTICRFA